LNATATHQLGRNEGDVAAGLLEQKGTHTRDHKSGPRQSDKLFADRVDWMADRITLMTAGLVAVEVLGYEALRLSVFPHLGDGSLHLAALVLVLVSVLPAWFVLWRYQSMMRLVSVADNQSRDELQMLRAVIEAVPEAIYIKDAESRFLLANPNSVRQMRAGSVDNVIGRNDFDFFPAEFAREYMENERDIIRTGESLLNHPETSLDPDGKPTWLLTSKVPFRNGRGQVAGIIGIGRDIRAQKQAEEAMVKAREAAESASRSKSEFLANMSHEIRTPLNGVIGMTDLVLDTDMSADQRDCLETVKLSADSLLTVLNDILDFSKIEAGKVDIESIEFNLRTCVEEAMKTFSLRAGDKDLELLCDVSHEVPEDVIGDPARLRQVILNLVSNAIKFTGQGEVAIKLEVESVEVEGNSCVVRFAVTDTGIGIPADKHESIFSAFTQADSSTTRQHGGTGLGLTISSRLVAMMGGRIWLESEVGKGTQCYFTIQFGVVKHKQESSSLPADSLYGMKILVVDDNRTNRRILEGLLTRWKARTTCVSSGKEALAALALAVEDGEPFKVLLTDLHMPEMDGLSLVEEIRRRPAIASIPTVMLSSGGGRGYAERCRQIDIKFYLYKPVRRSELLSSILHAAGRCDDTPELDRPISENQKLDAQTHERQKLDAQTLNERMADKRDKSASASPIQPSTSGRSLNILLAEDNLINQAVAQRIFQKWGHNLQIASNGKEALALLEKQSFNLVMMDIQMPEMDGIEATTRIRQNETGTAKRLPIIAMTAHAMKGDKERFLDAGVDGYVTKPISTADLEAEIERVLHLKSGDGIVRLTRQHV
jgi:two-component system, sensor histidine kinase and response regulator